MNNKERLALYRNMFHALHTASEVTMDPKRTMKLIHLISNWSHAHRGEYTFAEIKKNIDAAEAKMQAEISPSL